MQQDEWVVCRVFRKSAGVKKYPSSNPTRTINPYNLEVGPSIMPQPTMQLGDPTTHFLYGRNYMSNAELAEVTRVLRGNIPTNINLPMHSHLNFPVSSPIGGVGGGGFTISGLNLNLGGSTTQPYFRPLQPTQPSSTHTMAQMHDFNSNMIHGANGTTLAAENNVGYGADQVNNANPHGNRYMGIDHCVDLDNYWPNSY